MFLQQLVEYERKGQQGNLVLSRLASELAQAVRQIAHEDHQRGLIEREPHAQCQNLIFVAGGPKRRRQPAS